ncbi:MAG: hypothetical protein M3R58_05985 [Pseudomonadota bacterium]|nr:hypothetical protein [Pseudomonadota bacterium]
MTQLSVGSPRPQGLIATPAFWEVELPEGTPWTRSYRLSGGYLVRFPGLADFEIHGDLTRIDCHPAPEVGDETCRHLYRNQVLPMVLSHAGHLVFHASCIAVENGAVAFAGRSGTGKSTLAASFARNGADFLADDGLLVEEQDGGFRAVPAEPSIRLWGDSESALLEAGTRAAPPVAYTVKSRILGGPGLTFCTEALPLRAVYFLGEGLAVRPTIAPMSEAQALLGLAANTFLLDPDDRLALGAHFERLAGFARAKLCHVLDYPRSYGELAGVRDAILLHVQEGS